MLVQPRFKANFPGPILQPYRNVSHCDKKKSRPLSELHEDSGRSSASGIHFSDIHVPDFLNSLSLSLSDLLQRSAQIVDSIARIPRVNNLEYHVIADFQLSDHGVVLLPGSCRLLVDADNYQPGLKSLQVRK